MLSYIYVGSVISPWFLQPIRIPCHVKMIFWGPSNAFMRREIRNTKLRPANALFFVLHSINCFHTFEDTTVKTIIFVWKRYIFFRSPKCYRERTYSLYHCRLPSNNLTEDINHWDIYIISNISFRLKYIWKKQTTLEKVGFILRNSQLFLNYPRNSSGGRQIIYLFWWPPDKLLVSGGRQITLLATAR